MAGDDAVVDSVMAQLNVIRVNGIEELLSTGALLAYNRCRPAAGWASSPRRAGPATSSATRSSAQGIELPDFAPETVARHRAAPAAFATAHNPLDVTGYGLANAPTGMLTAIDYALEAAIEDPGLDFVLFGGVYLPDERPPEPMASMMEDRWTGSASSMAAQPGSRSSRSASPAST